MKTTKWLWATVFTLLLSGMVQAGWQDLLKSTVDEIEKSNISVPSSKGLSNTQIIQGLKEALAVGTEKAVGLLGKDGGFLNDAQVRIPLPGPLEKLGKGLRTIGQDELVDEFEQTINRAAERAVPETLSIFSDTIRAMSLEDARGILDGGDSAATEYFRDRGSDQLSTAILPIVQQATQKVGVTASYNELVGKAGFMADYIDMSALDLDQYVTQKALDGLFLKLAEQERLIRENPLARTTDILKTVFGQ